MSEPDTLTAPPGPSTSESHPVQVLPEVIAGRYTRRARLGRGGMGEVWRVWDGDLHRAVALKVLHGAPNPSTWARFEEEARVAAQLQHPGIIPVHDLGRLPDGRMWFTMKEVRGQTLAELIEVVHRDWRLGRESSWTFRRLLEGFLRVCETLAYAHARGVVHRDLKPNNLMFGDYGEVLVLDWGIAKVLSEAQDHNEPIHSELDSNLTRSGMISGTPNYMSPEQAQGRSAEAGPTADVYSLGATLYDILTERPPRLAKNPHELLLQVATGEPPIAPPSIRDSGAPIDEALDAIVLTALQVDEAERYPTAQELADDLRAWLDGARKREQARALVAQAETLLQRSKAQQARSTELQERASRALQSVAVNAPVSDKTRAWSLEDAARIARREAADAETRAIQQLRSSLTHYPALAEAHERLSDIFAARHRRLEAADRHDEARSVALDLAQHETGAYTHYLLGTGSVTLLTDTPVPAKLHRYVQRGRRWVPEWVRDLGTTPIIEAPVEMGSWLITLHPRDSPIIRYPIYLRRNEHWDSIAPGDAEPTTLRVPRPGELAEDDIYVPAGWFWVGDREFDATLPLARMWSDSFVVKRFPVTVGEYVAYLNALLDAGCEDQALAAEPRVSAHEPYLCRDKEGRWVGIAPDIEGLEAWPRTPDMPITLIDWFQARDYAEWLSHTTGLPWRLPMEREWQRFARGADLRDYPWGDHLEPTWCQMRYTPDNRGVVPVGQMPIDESPHGVRGCAGNVTDWVADSEADRALRADRVWTTAHPGEKRYGCGGACNSGPLHARIPFGVPVAPSHRHPVSGFRILRSWGETDTVPRTS